jgi:hypothetical protein
MNKPLQKKKKVEHTNDKASSEEEGLYNIIEQ